MGLIHRLQQPVNLNQMLSIPLPASQIHCPQHQLLLLRIQIWMRMLVELICSLNAIHPRPCRHWCIASAYHHLQRSRQSVFSIMAATSHSRIVYSTLTPRFRVILANDTRHKHFRPEEPKPPATAIQKPQVYRQQTLRALVSQSRAPQDVDAPAARPRNTWRTTLR